VNPAEEPRQEGALQRAVQPSAGPIQQGGLASQEDGQPERVGDGDRAHHRVMGIAVDPEGVKLRRPKRASDSDDQRLEE